MHHPILSQAPSLPTHEEKEAKRLAEIRAAELQYEPQRTHRSIMKVAEGICIRITNAVISENRSLDPDEISAHIEEEFTSVRKDAERFQTCNNSVALNHIEDVRSIAASLMSHYYPCPEARIADREATKKVLEQLNNDASQSPIPDSEDALVEAV